MSRRSTRSATARSEISREERLEALEAREAVKPTLVLTSAKPNVSLRNSLLDQGNNLAQQIQDIFLLLSQQNEVDPAEYATTEEASDLVSQILRLVPTITSPIAISRDPRLIDDARSLLTIARKTSRRLEKQLQKIVSLQPISQFTDSDINY